MEKQFSKFHIGQLIRHKLFDYRGVIIDVDPEFQNDDDWYEYVALSRPPKDKPWYRVLVHNAVHETYVAERNLEQDNSEKPINNPLVESIFYEFKDGSYRLKSSAN